MSYKNPSPKRQSRLSTPVRLGVAAVAACFIALPVLSNPVNPTVVNGTATFNQAGSALTVTNSNGAIINWDKFSIKAGETTHFAQPAASSAVLNRVLNDPTAIYGTLSSNGRVWLVNPAGIMVGPGGRVDTAGFVASTLAVRNEDFLAGRHLFVNDGNARNIINQGEIRTPAGGSVYLIGNNVSNEGIITTPKGETILAAGATVSLIDSATPGVKVDITGREGDATNLGQITAEAGRIGIAGVIVRNSGQLNASSVVNDGGRIFLKASQDAYVDKAGRIVTTGTKGGSVEVLGNRVAVMDDASVDVSGESGGGRILVGGDYQGKNPNVQNASITYFGPKASLKADATEVGDGGTVIVWADDTTRAYGNISARGGAAGGDGGFIETSAHRYLDVEGIHVNTGSSAGQFGTWLLDPTDITIVHSAAAPSELNLTGVTPFQASPSSSATSQLSDYTLNLALAGGNVSVVTTSSGSGNGDIIFGSSAVSVGPGSGTRTLTLNADRHIDLQGEFTLPGTGDFTVLLNPGMTIGGGKIRTLGGNTLTLNGAAGPLVVQVKDGKTWDNAGTVTLQSQGRVEMLNGSVFNNTGTFNATGTSYPITSYNTVTAPTYSINGSVFNNDGTFNYSNGGGGAWAITRTQFNNGPSALLSITGGNSNLNLENAGTLQGTINIPSGRQLGISEYQGNGTPILFSGTTFTGTGTLSIGNGTISNGLPGSAPATWSPYTHFPITFTNVSAPGTTVNLADNAQLTVSGGDAVIGTLTYSGGTVGKLVAINNGTLGVYGGDLTVPGGVTYSGNAGYLAAGNLTVDNSMSVPGGLTLKAGQSVAGLLSINAGTIYGGNITLNNPRGQVRNFTTLQTPGTLDVSAYGGINLGVDNQVGKFVASNTGTGGIDFFNTADFNLGAVTNTVPGGPIMIGGGNSITQTGNLASAGGAMAGGAISVSANTDLTMNAGTKAESFGGAIHYEATYNSVHLALLDAGAGAAYVTAGENITDGNGASTNNIKAGYANLLAGNDDQGPGGINVDTQVQTLYVDNQLVYMLGSSNPSNNNDVTVRNSGSPLAVIVFSALDTTQLTITNDNTINVGHIGGATHTTLTATGATSDITVAYGGGMGPATLLSGGDIILNAGRDIRIASDAAYGAYIQAANGINLTMLTGGLYIDGTSSMPAYVNTAMGDINVVTSTGFTNSDVLGNGTKGALDAGGRWLIYAPNPSTVVGAPAYNFKQYNTAFGGAIQGAGNGVVYTLAPTISGGLAGTVSKVYDGTNLATLTAANYGGLIGMVDGDTVAVLGNPTAASYDTKNVGTGKTVTVNGLTIAATNTTAAAYGGNAQVYGYLFDGTASGAIGAITPRSLGLTGLVAQNKVYDGTTKATLTGTLAGMVTGDIVGFAPGAGSFVDRHVGTAKTVNISGLALAGKDAGNYTLAGTTSSTTANITQLASVNWVGGTDTQWSTATNWAGGALPDRANVAAVILGNGPVTYDYGNAPTDTPILNALNLAGGTLTVTGGMLTVPTWLQSGGDLRGLGGLTVSQSMVMNGLGTIDIGGPVTISHTGNLHLGRIKTAGALSVTATGTLSGTNAAGTWVQTASSILLDASGIGTATDMLQTRTQELAINNRVGDAWIFNTGLVDVSGSSAGRLHLESHGGIVAGSSAQVTAGGKLDLIAHSPIVIGAAGVQGGTGVVLRADTPDPSNSSILISGPVSSPGGAVVVAAYNNVTQNANITGGSVSVGSAAGSIQMAATAQTQATGGNVSYKAPAGSMTLATINAGSGSVSLDAGGSIAPAPGTTGANITGASAFINAGGSLELSTNVTLLDVDVGGAFAVSNGGTVFSGQPAASTSGADQATKDLTNATNKALTDKTPTDRTEAPPPHDTSKTDTSKPFVDPGKTTGGTDGTFGSEGDKPSTETRKDGSGSKTASSGKDENGKDQKDEKDEKDKKDKKSDEAKDEKKDDKPVAKKVAQCT